MPRLRARYCGIVWYFLNSACHAGSDSGGRTPVTGFHSTMERPDSVSRVAPPTRTVAITSAATATSQNLMARIRMSADGSTECGSRLRGSAGPYRAGPCPRNQNPSIVMPIRTRNLIGAVLLLVLLVVWVLLGLVFAQNPLMAENRLLAAMYYVVVGLGWVLPAMPIIRWMVRPDRAETET